jgi:hypothetical protein
MKQNNKKVPDAPERYFVGPFPKPIHDITKSSLFAAMNQWVGIKEKLLAEDHEYINLSHVWHLTKDMPDYMDELIVVTGNDYSDPKIIDLQSESSSYIYEDMDEDEIWGRIIDEHDFTHWAYYSCFIPYHF